MAGPGAAALRLALYLDLSVLFGLAAFTLYALRGVERGDGTVLPLRATLTGAALFGAALSVLWLLMLAASLDGAAISEVELELVGEILTGTDVGTAWTARLGALLTVALAAFFIPSRPRPAVAMSVLAGAVAVATLAWTGHGAAAEGTVGWIHLLSDIAHLLAAGAWVGALVAFMLLLFRRASAMTAERLRLSHRALHGFSAVGTAAVAILVLTGAVNSWLLVGVDRVAALLTTTYGLLLLAKLALFAAMLGLAAANRFRLTPALEAALARADHRAALGALRLSLAVETACAVAILALVAWLGLLEPPASL